MTEYDPLNGWNPDFGPVKLLLIRDAESNTIPAIQSIQIG